MTPNAPKLVFLAHFHRELVGPLYFYISQNGPWSWVRPNLDQGRGSAWTRHGAHPGPGIGRHLDPAGARSGTMGQASAMTFRRNFVENSSKGSSKIRRKSNGGPTFVEISSKIRRTSHTFVLKKVSMTLQLMTFLSCTSRSEGP